MTFQRIAVIYNPWAGRPRKRRSELDRFRDLLCKRGYSVEVLPTQWPGHATQLAREAAGRGCDLIVAHGGDGTVNEVLQGVMGTEATLCFWPGGTANVLAAELRFPSGVNEVAKRIDEARVERVTVGKANERYFMLMAGIGLDAGVVAGVRPELKKWFGKGAYGFAALRFIWTWRLPPLRIHADSEELEGRFVIVGNARSYGGGFQLTPQANLAEPLLDLLVVVKQRRLDYVPIILASVFGIHLRLPGVLYRKVQHVHIACDLEVPVQLDGELAGHVPVSLEAIPGAVKLLT